MRTTRPPSRRLALVAALALSLGTSLGLPAAAAAGPPWISVELPANPFDRASRGAYLLVHSFHHGTAVGLPVTGRAEGVVNGRRRTVPLRLEATSRQGVYALHNQWGTEGTWTLVLTVRQGPEDTVGATALVELSADGRVAVRVPTQRHREGDFPRAVSAEEVDQALRARAAARVAAEAGRR
jgi:hypothetical protein